LVAPVPLESPLDAVESGALSKAALKKFFVDVGNASPIPVMVYNCESAAGGALGGDLHLTALRVACEGDSRQLDAANVG
jgi:hypothetical protein